MSIRKVKEIIFLGTGTSSGVPVVACLTDPEGSCETCRSTLTPEGEVNIRRNTSLLVRVNHEDGRIRNIVIDCGKTFYVSALKWWPYYKLRRIDALILTHPHADAINGLDDLRAWTLHQVIQEHIPIYLTKDTLESIEALFPYIVDTKKATGGGDIPSFQWNVIDSYNPFTVEGLEFDPLPVHHGKYFTKDEPYIYVGFKFDNISYISDCNFIPENILTKIQGSDIVVLDALDHKEHTSHFSIDQAIDTSRKLNPIPTRTYLTGFSHAVEHFKLVNEMKQLQLNEPSLWVRPAHDGLRVILDNLDEEQEETKSNLVKNNKVNNGIINGNGVINGDNNGDSNGNGVIDGDNNGDSNGNGVIGVINGDNNGDSNGNGVIDVINGDNNGDSNGDNNSNSNDDADYNDVIVINGDSNGDNDVINGDV